MQVTAAWAFDRNIPEAAFDLSAPASDARRFASLINNPGALHRLADAVSLNSTAGLDIQRSHVGLVGNPTEAALLCMLYSHLEHDYSEAREAAAPYLLARRPFDKASKYMASLYAAEAGRARLGAPGERAIAAVATAAAPATLYVKGAPEMVLDMCAAVSLPGSGSSPITADKRFEISSAVQAMARRGLRTLAVAYRPVTPDLLSSLSGGKLTGRERAGEKTTRDAYAPLLAVPAYGSTPASPSAAGSEELSSPFAPPCGLESGLVLLGVFGIADPVREGVPAALEKCMQAGIRVIMVTGDHPDTAQHIAEQCGILRYGSFGRVMEGPQFRALGDEGRKEALKTLAVLARSSPTDKHALVTCLKEVGEIVAVTGDGTNDAPALRAGERGRADCACAGTPLPACPAALPTPRPRTRARPNIAS